MKKPLLKTIQVLLFALTLLRGVECQEEAAIQDGTKPRTAAFIPSVLVVDAASDLSIGTTCTAQERQRSTVSAFREVSPAVVHVETETSGGTGIIISRTFGYVLTCSHVVSGSDFALVILADKRYYFASVIGRDDFLDVALLQLQMDENATSNKKDRDETMISVSASFPSYDWNLPSSIAWKDPLPTAKLGNSTKVQIGTQIISVGCGRSVGMEASSGIVTGFFHDDRVAPSIMTDSTTYGGFSGGPVVDVDSGTVIGINQRGLLSIHMFRFQSSQDKMYHADERFAAIPIDSIKEILPRLKRGDTITHATIGVRLRTLNQDLPQGKLTTGAEIVHIDGGASRKRPFQRGLLLHDVIVEIDGTRVDTALDARQLVDRATVGEELKISVIRKEANKIELAVIPKALKISKRGSSSIPLVKLLNFFWKGIRDWFHMRRDLARSTRMSDDGHN